MEMDPAVLIWSRSVYEESEYRTIRTYPSKSLVVGHIWPDMALQLSADADAVDRR